MKGVGPVSAVVDGQARRAAGGQGRENGRGGRAVGFEGEGGPARRDRDDGEGGGRSGRDAEGLGGGDAQDEGGGEEEKRIGARAQNPGFPGAGALWLSSASSTRWLRTRIPSGMARSSGLKFGLCRGAIVAWEGFLTPRKK